MAGKAAKYRGPAFFFNQEKLLSGFNSRREILGLPPLTWNRGVQTTLDERCSLLALDRYKGSSYNESQWQMFGDSDIISRKDTPVLVNDRKLGHLLIPVVDPQSLQTAVMERQRSMTASKQARTIGCTRCVYKRDVATMCKVSD